jgi:hypothetical protein
MTTRTGAAARRTTALIARALDDAQAPSMVALSPASRASQTAPNPGARVNNSASSASEAGAWVVVGT